MINNKEILITGGTGSLGTALVKLLKARYKPRGIRIFSRSELKQAEMKAKFGHEGISYLIGDIRDRNRLKMASYGVDIIINCAAIKRIEVAENDPIECIKTNITGTENVIYAALENQVEKVFHISTDKAVYPTTLYGSTKKCAEDLIIRANIYKKRTGLPRFSCARYGNVFGSNGSVIQLFQKQKALGVLTVTDLQMTRFWITIPTVAQFILDRIDDMRGGEIFVPKMASMAVVDIAKTISPEAKIKTIGLRGMEKLHECLITEEESAYVSHRTPIASDTSFYTIDKSMLPHLLDKFTYSSDKNSFQLTRDALRKMIEEL